MSGTQDVALVEANGEDESDWEYEYHETETEDAYIVLDFTADPQAGRPPSDLVNPFRLQPRGPPQEKRKADSAPPAASPRAETMTTPATPAKEGPLDPGLDESQATDAQGRDRPADSLQIVELHADNPVIAYGDSLYNCHWAQTLGTDLFFAAAPERRGRSSAKHNSDNNDGGPQDFNMAHPPLRCLRDHDLLALSSTKLIAMPANLRVRPVRPTELPPVPDDLRVPVPPDATDAQKRQAEFLERLAAVKRAKGETDRVPRTGDGTRVRGKRRVRSVARGPRAKPVVKSRVERSRGEEGRRSEELGVESGMSTTERGEAEVGSEPV